jgi:hypothetical protein
MNQNDLSPYRYPLRPDVRMFSEAGYVTEADFLIERLLKDDAVDQFERERLLLEKHRLSELCSDFPYDGKEALRLLKENDPSASETTLTEYRLSGKVPTALVDGTIHYHRRFLDTVGKQVMSEERKKDLSYRRSVAEQLRKYGHAEASLTVHIGVAMPKDLPSGSNVHVELPLPVTSMMTHDVKILRQGGGLVSCDAEKSRRRCARFDGKAGAGDEFWIEYSLVNSLQYQDMEKLTECCPITKPWKCKEEPPYLVKTPYLEDLASSICDGERNPLRRAKRIYEYVTRNLRYSYMPTYQSIANLAEYGAMMRSGDCGIKASLFIMLCRLSGIKADWRGGMYATPDGISNHDWALFAIPEVGSFFADCSFGSSEDPLLHEQYFGNLDLMRIPCCSVLAHAKEIHGGFWRSDPTDNQNAEAWLDDKPLSRNDLIDNRKIVSFSFR